jgi:hypothetical protein
MLESTTIRTASVGVGDAFCTLAMGNGTEVEIIGVFVSCKQSGTLGPVYINTFCNVNVN